MTKTQPADATPTTPAEPIPAMIAPANDRLAYADPATDGAEPTLAEQTLAERISAAQTRIAERTAPARAKALESTKAAAGSAKSFVVRHPLIAISGAIAAGAGIALVLPGKPGRKMRGSVVSAGSLLAELVATYGGQMMSMAEDAAGSSRGKIEEIGKDLTESGESVAHRLTNAGEQALSNARHVGEDAASKTRSMIARLRR